MRGARGGDDFILRRIRAAEGDVFPDGRNAEPLLQETDLVFGFRGVLLQVFADIEVTAV